MPWQHQCQSIWCLVEDSRLMRLDMNQLVHKKTLVTGHDWSKKPMSLAGTVCWKVMGWNNGSYSQAWDSSGQAIWQVLNNGLDASSLSSLKVRTNKGYTKIRKCTFEPRVVWRLKRMMISLIDPGNLYPYCICFSWTTILTIHNTYLVTSFNRESRNDLSWLHFPNNGI